MKNIYEKCFDKLLKLVRDSRDNCVRRTEEFAKAKNSIKIWVMFGLLAIPTWLEQVRFAR